MNRKIIIANSALWAAAVVSAAILGAPAFFTIVLLPLLATLALSSMSSRRIVDRCATGSQ